MADQATAISLKIDREKCCGYAICVALAPEIFGMGDDGIAYVDEGSIPHALAGKARQAAAGCPEKAIALISEVGGDE